MIFLLLQLGPDRYAVETSRVAEVLPMVSLKSLPQTAPGIAGAFNYHGAPVPVVDLALLALGRPARRSLSTRLVLVHYAAGGQPRLLGLLVEQTTATAHLEPGDFKDPGARPDGAPYLGPVATDARGLIQRVEIEQLLSADVRAQLWPQVEACP